MLVNEGFEIPPRRRATRVTRCPPTPQPRPRRGSSPIRSSAQPPLVSSEQPRRRRAMPSGALIDIVREDGATSRPPAGGRTGRTPPAFRCAAGRTDMRSSCRARAPRHPGRPPTHMPVTHPQDLLSEGRGTCAAAPPIEAQQAVAWRAAQETASPPTTKGRGQRTSACQLNAARRRPAGALAMASSCCAHPARGTSRVVGRAGALRSSSSTTGKLLTARAPRCSGSTPGAAAHFPTRWSPNPPPAVSARSS